MGYSLKVHFGSGDCGSEYSRGAFWHDDAWGEENKKAVHR